MATAKATAQTAAFPDDHPSEGTAQTLASLGIAFDGPSSYYMSRDEKDAVLSMSPAPTFHIVGVQFDTDNEYGDRYLVEIVPTDDPSAEVRAWQFGANETNEKTHKPMQGVIARNVTLASLKLKADATGKATRIGPVIFKKIGRFVTLADAQ